MEYRFVSERQNYEDFASGMVLYNRSGNASFPVRLADEIFQRCGFYLDKKGRKGPHTLYDPCCGGAYLLSVLGYLHGNEISRILASDIDENAVELARRNLSLLTPEGLNRRTEQIQKLFNEYGKESHQKALVYCSKFKEILYSFSNPPDTECFCADITDIEAAQKFPAVVDMVITDLPYGNLVSWAGDENDGIAAEKMLGNLKAALKPGAVAAIISTKKASVKHDGYARVEHFNVGKRKVTILEHME